MTANQTERSSGGLRQSGRRRGIFFEDASTRVTASKPFEPQRKRKLPQRAGRRAVLKRVRRGGVAKQGPNGACRDLAVNRQALRSRLLEKMEKFINEGGA